MGTPVPKLITDHLAASLMVLQAACKDDDFLRHCEAIGEICVTSLKAGGKLLLAGNGGSAGDAQHIAGEFLSRLNFDRGPLPAIALTVDTSVLTAVGNDYGFEHIFERQVVALAKPADVFIGISTSGRSPNILAALRAARRIGVKTIGFTGVGGGAMIELCDSVLTVPSSSTPLIQQLHIVAAHAICAHVEATLFGKTL